MTSAFRLHDTVLLVSNEAKRLISERSVITSERKLLAELILCILSSQDKFEIAVSATRSLLKNNVLKVPADESELEKLSVDVRRILLEPVRFSVGKKRYERKLRFNKRKTDYVLSTIENIYLNDLTLGKILDACDTPDKTRRLLIRYACGIGPKQASMFLRNVGFYSDFAVLDKHVIEFMRMMAIYDSGKSPATIARYEALESGLKSYANAYEVGMLHLDLAIWTTMRTLRGQFK